MGRNVKIDPARTRVHGHRLNPDAVRYYENHPGGRFRGSGGKAVAQRQPDGTIDVLNGAHRRQAAINKGRKLEVDLYEPGEKLPSVESGCLLLMIAGLGSLAGVAMAVREVLPL